ncbi:MAG: type II toxin-antitoxin system RelE/ParE family toxin [Gammaproteobacteria bacterium]|nr:MAG: type II toxin-antitoxin system RelE/ParE family toxin [Gammaproteobacteria bacterium]RLA49354.1 MAG: type II toxin-antitoxin system RelE/ParE family toxin [Gammaproteobacteria bacterium]
MAKAKVVLQTPGFKKAVRKLKANQKKDLDSAIKELMANPDLGDQKKGDLSFLRVYKFKMIKQLTLLGYNFDSGKLTIALLAQGANENFYRDLKRKR